MKPLEVNCCVGGECPEALWETRVSKQTATKFDSGTNTTFARTVLPGGVWGCYFNQNSFCAAKTTPQVIDPLPAATNSDNFQLLVGLFLEFGFEKFERCKCLLR
jgi:hypothetical protein